MLAFTVHLYSHTMYVFTVSFEIATRFASVRALVATKPFNVDIVDVCKMSLIFMMTRVLFFLFAVVGFLNFVKVNSRAVRRRASGPRELLS